jgi:hypothetical protein
MSMTSWKEEKTISTTNWTMEKTISMTNWTMEKTMSMANWTMEKTMSKEMAKMKDSKRAKTNWKKVLMKVPPSFPSPYRLSKSLLL